jgi:hypothetical protein
MTIPLVPDRLVCNLNISTRTLYTETQKAVILIRNITIFLKMYDLNMSASPSADLLASEKKKLREKY